MVDFINKIKQFFRKIVLKIKTKKLKASEDNDLIVNDFSDNQIKNNIKDFNEKKEFFEIYNKVKKGQYDLNKLTEEQSKKIIAILNSEISLKKDKLNQDIMELNILKVDNKIDEKNRILELYNGVKNGNIYLNGINKEDLLKIRRLLLEESKMHDEKFENEIKLLEILKSVS